MFVNRLLPRCLIKGATDAVRDCIASSLISDRAATTPRREASAD